MVQAFLDATKKRVPQATLMQMDMRSLDFPDNSFDGMWLDASFLHISKKDAKSTLRTFYRVLRSGGLLFIGVKEGTGERFVEEKGMKRFFAFYTKGELEQLLQETGFTILKTELITTKTTTWVDVFAEKP